MQAAGHTVRTPDDRGRVVHPRSATRAKRLFAGWPARIASCNRCPTSARPSGTWPTSPGSSRRSCSGRICRVTRRSIPEFEFLFNSYYNSVGEQFPRPRRGLLSRPTLAEVRDYRAEVDDAMLRLLADPERLTGRNARAHRTGIASRATTSGIDPDGHQARLFLQPARPRVCGEQPGTAGQPRTPALDWIAGDEGLRTIGYDGTGFTFDNERPAHQVFIPAFELASRLVTNGEYLEFIEAGGYATPGLWLGRRLGHRAAPRSWRAPLYWIERDGEWFEFTLTGLRPLDLCAPACHVSYYEADAFATWKGAAPAHRGRVGNRRRATDP